MTLQEALAKIVPKVRENIIKNLNGTNNKELKRTRTLKTAYLKAHPTYWKYPQPQSKTLLNSVKVAQLRNSIVVKTAKYGLYLETGTKYIKPARPWFKDAFTQTIKKDLAKELKKYFIDEIKVSLR
jgi:hypothetical protein